VYLHVKKHLYHNKENVMMDQLTNYSTKEQDFILKTGMYALENARILTQTTQLNDPNSGNVGQDKKIKQLEVDLYKTRQENHEYVIAHSQQFTTELDRRSEHHNFKVEVLNEKLCEERTKYKTLKDEITTLKNMYSSFKKGVVFEKQIYENISNMNDLRFNSSWTCKHVGQKHGHKGDIILEHKDDTSLRVMIDVKNVKDTVAKIDREKFLVDMRNISSNLHVGIMISTGRISSMRNFEIKTDQDKHLVYVSNFQLGQEGFIFSILDYIVQLRKPGCKEEEHRKTIECVQERYSEFYDVLRKQTDTLSKHIQVNRCLMDNISFEYQKLFKMDIETSKKTKNKK
jgi:hypothetical protein